MTYVRENRLDRERCLVEISLVERFGVSRTLIRTALKRLVDQRVLGARCNHGFFVLKA